MDKGGISYIDLAIVAFLLIFIFRGYKRGFTEEFMRILGTLIGLIVAIRYMSDVSHFILGAIDIPLILAIIISYAVLFFATIFMFKFITEKLKKAISFSIALGGIDKIVGGALGLLKGAIIISLITILLSMFNLSDFSKRHISQSALFNPMRKIAPLVYDVVKIFVPHPKSFLSEFEENLSGFSLEKRGQEAEAFIKFYKKK